MPGDLVGPRGLRRLLDAVMTVGSGLELRVVLERVVEAAVELVDARYGALGVLDEAGTWLTEFITVGMDDQTRRAIGELPKGLGLLGSLIRDAEPLRLADLHEHADSVGFPGDHPPMTSFLGVPIRVRGDVFGILYLTDKTTGEVFTDVDEELARGLATAAGVAIANARLFGQVNRREAALAAMGEVAGFVLAGADRVESLSLVARLARELVNGELATIAVPRPDGVSMVIEAADGALWEGVGVQFPIAGSVSGEALRSSEMTIVDDASKDHRRSQPQVSSGRVGPAVWVALAAENRRFGTLSVARAVGAAPFTENELELVRFFAAQASVILRHDEDRQNLQRLTLLEDQERIARDLHDSVIQRLFATGLSLQGVVKLIGEPRVEQRVVEAVNELDITIRHIRTAIFGLEESCSTSAPELRARTLELAGEAARILGFDPQLRFDGPVDTVVTGALTEELLTTLRESLTNVARHASASQVEVDLTVNAEKVSLQVWDNGIGIDIAASRSGGHGLSNMRARAERLGGHFSIEPASNGGTILTWQAPLPT